MTTEEVALRRNERDVRLYSRPNGCSKGMLKMLVFICKNVLVKQTEKSDIW